MKAYLNYFVKTVRNAADFWGGFNLKEIHGKIEKAVHRLGAIISFQFHFAGWEPDRG